MIPASNPRIILHEIHRPIKIDGPAVVQTVVTDQRCPVCDKRGHWRMGQEFDHEMRCPTCSSLHNSIIWEPGKTYLKIEIDGRKIPAETIGLVSTGDVTSHDIDILGHFASANIDHLPDVEIHPEGATIDLRGEMEDPQENRKEILLQSQALALSGLSDRALGLIQLARAEGIDLLKLDGCHATVTGDVDPSWG